MQCIRISYSKYYSLVTCLKNWFAAVLLIRSNCEKKGNRISCMHMEPRQPRKTVGTVGALPAVNEFPGSRKPEFTRFNEEKLLNQCWLHLKKNNIQLSLTYSLLHFNDNHWSILRENPPASPVLCKCVICAKGNHPFSIYTILFTQLFVFYIYF